jgi:hypothetical protein
MNHSIKKCHGLFYLKHDIVINGREERKRDGGI